MKLICGDAMTELDAIPDATVDLILADPPYNVGVTTQKDGKKRRNEWDVIDGYAAWTVEWVQKCVRKMKPNGVAYIWQGDPGQMAEIMQAIRKNTPLVLRSLCIWDKGDGFRAQSWHKRDVESGKSVLRCWFNRCEFALHYFNCPAGNDKSWKITGLDRIYSTKECFAPIKKWYNEELERMGITAADIARKYTEVTGRKPYMLRHYFQDSQFEIPTEQVWEAVYRPLGFAMEYEGLRREYEGLRNYHRCDDMHCNVWQVPPIPSNNRMHTCQKPVEILRRMIRVSCPPGGVVLDPFMGSGSTGCACKEEGMEFIGIEKDKNYFEIAKKRIDEYNPMDQITMDYLN